MIVEPEDAIEILKTFREAFDNDEVNFREQLIGAIDSGIASLSKEIAMKPTLISSNINPHGFAVMDIWMCPRCGKRYSLNTNSFKYCPKCGQHISELTSEEN